MQSYGRNVSVQDECNSSDEDVGEYDAYRYMQEVQSDDENDGSEEVDSRLPLDLNMLSDVNVSLDVDGSVADVSGDLGAHDPDNEISRASDGKMDLPISSVRGTHGPGRSRSVAGR